MCGGLRRALPFLTLVRTAEVKGGSTLGSPVGSWMPGSSPGMTTFHEHPVVDPQVSHFMHVPFLTKVKFPHSPHISPS
jgi:hypothetical protein